MTPSSPAKRLTERHHSPPDAEVIEDLPEQTWSKKGSVVISDERQRDTLRPMARYWHTRYWHRTAELGLPTAEP
jgi:hypothetical protein